MAVVEVRDNDPITVESRARLGRSVWIGLERVDSDVNAGGLEAALLEDGRRFVR